MTFLLCFQRNWKSSESRVKLYHSSCQNVNLYLNNYRYSLAMKLIIKQLMNLFYFITHAVLCLIQGLKAKKPSLQNQKILASCKMHHAFCSTDSFIGLFLPLHKLAYPGSLCIHLLLVPDYFTFYIPIVGLPQHSLGCAQSTPTPVADHCRGFLGSNRWAELCAIGDKTHGGCAGALWFHGTWGAWLCCWRCLHPVGLMGLCLGCISALINT